LAEAQYSLGRLYAGGSDVPQSWTEARMWFEKAAQQGHVGAQFNLGHIYRSGNDVPRDGKQAVVWYERAAAQGNGQAMLSLALVYDAGESVAVDKAKAIYWYEQAGQSGIAQACGNLAVMYLTGTDVQQAPSREWFGRSCPSAPARDSTIRIKAVFFSSGICWLRRCPPNYAPKSRERQTNSKPNTGVNSPQVKATSIGSGVI